MPTPVSATSIRAPSGVAATSTVIEPPRGVNFTALPTRLATTWPMRCGSCLMRTGDTGMWSDTRTSPALRGSGGLVDCVLDGRPEIVRPQIEQHEPRIQLRELEQVLGKPVEPLDLLAARFEELGAGLRIGAGAALEKLVEHPERGERRPELVRDVGQEVPASVAVATDDLDALLEPVGHGVELECELGKLRASRSGPRPRARAASGRLRPGPVRPRSSAAGAS